MGIIKALVEKREIEQPAWGWMPEAGSSVEIGREQIAQNG